MGTEWCPVVTALPCPAHGGRQVGAPQLSANGFSRAPSRGQVLDVHLPVQLQVRFLPLSLFLSFQVASEDPKGQASFLQICSLNWSPNVFPKGYYVSQLLPEVLASEWTSTLPSHPTCLLGWGNPKKIFNLLLQVLASAKSLVSIDNAISPQAIRSFNVWIMKTTDIY